MSIVDRGPVIFTVCLVGVVLASAFAACRLVSKWGITKKQSPDDWLVLVAWAFTVALGVSVMIGTQNGLGMHDGDITATDLRILRPAIYTFTIFYNPAIMATKSAILLLYMRMASAHRFFKIASAVVLGIVNVAGVVLTCLNIFQCRPISAAWTGEEGNCIDIVSMYLASAPVNVATDLAILLLPLPILTSLRIEFRQKVVLVTTFIVGGFVTIVDIIRIAYLQNALQAQRLYVPGPDDNSGRPADFLYEISFTCMWTTVEVSVGLMCACVLVMKPLVMRVLPSLLRGPNRRRSSAGTDNTKVPRSPQPTMPPIMEDPLSQPSADPMDFMQMLADDEPLRAEEPAAPPYRKMSRLSRISIRRVSRDQSVQEPTQRFFDFVNMGGEKPLPDLTAREAWWPVLFVSTLFFMWGFSYGLLGTLNGQIQKLQDYSSSQSIALHSSYWLGYVVGPPTVGYWTLTKSSFKSTFIAGLCLYAVGALSFWPSSVLLSYPGFFISNFIIACGLSCLEVAANLFITLAGPSHLSESRLNFAQGIQAVGSVLSPILAKKALFNDINQKSIFNMQWCYLAVALVVVGLAVVFYYFPLSEATDDVLEVNAQQALASRGLDASASLKFFGVSVSARTALLAFGTVTMFIYVGAQETISYFWMPTSTFIYGAIDPFWVQAISHAVFAVGRFMASGICYIGVPPRIVLLASIFGALICSLLTLVLPAGQGALATLILITFFEAAIFPTLFAITLRNQGSRSKLVSAVLVTAISGGGALPVTAWGAQQHHMDRPRYSLIIVTVLYGVAMVMPGWLCGGMRAWVDPPRAVAAVVVPDIEVKGEEGSLDPREAV